MSSPTLVIGLGTFGSAAVVEVKRLCSDFAADTLVPAAFLAIDQREAIDDPAGRLAAEEKLPLRPRRAIEILEHMGAPSGDRSAWRDLLEWFPRGESYALVDALERCGAEGYRPLGRLGLFAADEIVERALRKGIVRARCASSALDPDANVRVVVVSSLSGGVGSGMVLDVAHLARRLDDRSLLMGYFCLPGALAELDYPNRREANTYAALQEIAMLRAGSIRFEVEFERIRGIRGIVPRELFARTFLFGAEVSCRDHDGPVCRTARAIAAQLRRDVQRATICAVQGMSRLVDEAGRRELAPTGFGTAAAHWLSLSDLRAADEALGHAAEEPAAHSGLGPAAERGEDARGSDGAEAPPPSKLAVPAIPRVLDEKALSELTSEFQREIRARLERFRSSLTAKRRELSQREREMRDLEGLHRIERLDGRLEWTIDPAALAAHELFIKANGAARLSRAVEDAGMEKPTAASATPSPAVVAPSAPALSAIVTAWLDGWLTLRRRGRWIRRLGWLWPRRWQDLLDRRAERLAELTLLPELGQRLRTAIVRSWRSSGVAPAKDSAAVGRAAAVPDEVSTSGSAAANGSGERERSSRWQGHLRQRLRDLREGVFGDPEPRPRRQAFLLALVPTSFDWPGGFPALKNALEGVAGEIEARCLIERCSGDHLWLVVEDLFNAAAHVRLLQRFRDAYERGEANELHHVDRRWAERVRVAGSTPATGQGGMSS